MQNILFGIACFLVAGVAFASFWLPSKPSPEVNPKPSDGIIAGSSQVVIGDPKLDREFLDLAIALNQEIDSVEKQLTNSILPTTQIDTLNESSSQLTEQSLDESGRDESQSIEHEFPGWH